MLMANVTSYQLFPAPSAVTEVIVFLIDNDNGGSRKLGLKYMEYGFLF